MAKRLSVSRSNCRLAARKPSSTLSATSNATPASVSLKRRSSPKSAKPASRKLCLAAAVNTPLQGTAADLIKLAMIRIARLLDERKMQSRMLLQVHDELVFEAPPAEKDDLQELVKTEMESVYRLSVPL